MYIFNDASAVLQNIYSDAQNKSSRTLFDTLAMQLAIDEALLIDCEELQSQEEPREWLRIWEFDTPVVVLGRSSKIDQEVNRVYCQREQIPVFRRCSGGASIVAGQGCLIYSLVLSFDARPMVQKLDGAHRFVMSQLLQAVRRQRADVTMQGTCDLTWNDRKFSGNSARIARKHLLYHGTILYDADVSLITRCLAPPPRQPEYRHERPHDQFVTNLSIDPVQFTQDLQLGFAAQTVPESLQATVASSIESHSQQLWDQRYSQQVWHERH
jgi:lipoate-protein ligase A